MIFRRKVAIHALPSNAHVHLLCGGAWFKFEPLMWNPWRKADLHYNMLQVNRGMRFPVSHQSPLAFASFGLSLCSGLWIRHKNIQSPLQFFIHMQHSIECLNLNIWQGQMQPTEAQWCRSRKSGSLNMALIRRTMSCHEKLWPPRSVVRMFFILRTIPVYGVEWCMT